MTAYDPDRATFVPYVPPAYGKTPTTPAEVLDAAACVLEEEGRWAQQHWYQHHDREHEEFQDNPWCNGWSVCADGALQAVTLGAYRLNEWNAGWFISGLSPAHPDSEDGATRYGLYLQALRLVEQHVSRDGVVRAITTFNDNYKTTRDDVVTALRDAAKSARDDEPVPA